MGLRPEEKDDDAPKEPFKRTPVQCGCTVMAIILNLMLLFGGGVLMLYLGVHAVINLDGDVAGAPSRGANFSIAFGVLAVVMSALFTIGFKKKPKQPCVLFVQFLLLVFLGVFTAMFAMIFVTEDVRGVTHRRQPRRGRAHSPPQVFPRLSLHPRFPCACMSR